MQLYTDQANNNKVVIEIYSVWKICVCLVYFTIVYSFTVVHADEYIALINYLSLWRSYIENVIENYWKLVTMLA